MSSFIFWQWSAPKTVVK